MNLKKELLENGGFTVRNGKKVNGGFVCAVKGFEKIIKLENLTLHVLKHFKKKHKNVLKKPNRHLGGWLDKTNNLIYLDISEIYRDKNKALQIAKNNNEIAIFDLDNLKEIRL